MTDGQNRRAPLRRLALVAASVSLVLLVGEGAASLFGGRSAFRGLHRVREGAPWLYDLEPRASAHADGVRYRINANGFRDAERSVAKPPGVFRVAVLGDSVAFGYGVDVADGFVARLEDALAGTRDGDGPRIEVLNFAVSGYNPYNEVELYRGVVRPYEPDLVLAQFCINDLNDPTLHFGASTIARIGELPELAFPNPAERRRAPREVSGLALLCERSNLCALLFGGLVAASREPSDADAWRTGFEIREGRAFDVEWDWLRARYADLARSVRADGARFGVLAFPYEAEVKSAAVPEAPDDDDARSATGALTAIARREGWPAIDLLPAFRAAQGGEGARLFLDVWHPSAEGHRVAADAIARALACRQLVPLDAPADCGSR